MDTLPAPPDLTDGEYRVDVAVVGAGVAGLYAAMQLPDGLAVTVLDKGTAGRSGSSPWAQGGLAAALGDEDSPDAHAADTIRAGDGLCDAVAVEVLTREAPRCVADLVARGARFDRLPDQTGSDMSRGLHLAREGAQSHARSVHRADATGAELIRVLRAAAGPRVSRLGGVAVALARGDDGRTPRVCGVWLLHPRNGLVLVRARAVLLATGGCGGLFAATTNQDGATADGISLAAAAGAAVRDLEFVQFHPTGMAVGGSWRFLLTESLRGAGATLHAEDGARFMLSHHPDAELAPRHVVAKAILDQPGGQAWLDATSLGAEALAREFPTVLAGAREHGFDLASERVPVTPAAHYMVGGVRTDLDGQTSLPGLYAAGEVASTGVHGANRMAGNSLSEALVFGTRAARALAHGLAPNVCEVGEPPRLRDETAGPDELATLRARLREHMWRDAGPARSATSLATAATELDDLGDALGPPRADTTHVELTHALTTARLIVAAATRRRESRGGHHRLDHPDHDPALAGVHLEQIRLSHPTSA